MRVQKKSVTTIAVYCWRAHLGRGARVLDGWLVVQADEHFADGAFHIGVVVALLDVAVGLLRGV